MKVFNSPTISTWSFTGARFLVLIFVLTLILKKFSTLEIALWYLYISIQSFAHLFDTGFSTTITRFAAYSVGDSENKKNSKNNNDLSELYASMNSIYIFLSLFVFLFLICMLFFSVKPLLVENNQVDNFISFLPVLTIMPLVFFLKKNDAFLKGLGKISLYNNWNAIMYLLNGIILILILYLDFSFFTVVLVSQLGLLINAIKNFFLLKKELRKDFKFMNFSLNKKVLLKYWRPTWRSALISLSSNGMNHMTGILLPLFFPVGIVASYLFSLRLILIVNEFSWAPFYSQIPLFIKKYRVGNLSYLNENVWKRMNISLVILISGLSVLGVLANYFISIFNFNTDFISTKLLAFILVMTFFERVISMQSQVIMFSNLIEHYKYYIFLAFVYVLSLYLSLNYFGLYSIPFSYYIAMIFPLYVITRKSLKILNVGFDIYLNKGFVFTFLSLLVSFLLLITL